MDFQPLVYFQSYRIGRNGGVKKLFIQLQELRLKYKYKTKTQSVNKDKYLSVYL